MKRQNMVSAYGNYIGWFDLDKAKCFGEETVWDGHNHISVNTGSQWAHQCVYRTAGGTWILNEYSAYSETWEKIGEKEAFEWLAKNGHLESLPQDTISEFEVV